MPPWTVYLSLDVMDVVLLTSITIHRRVLGRGENEPRLIRFLVPRYNETRDEENRHSDQELRSGFRLLRTPRSFLLVPSHST